MQSYHDDHGKLPIAAVRGKDGRPLHSWRVALLPYLGHADLYKQFQHDEPWNSDHNLKLLPKMPSIYASPWNSFVFAPANHTFCRVIVGPGCAFEAGKHLNLERDFAGSGNRTVLLVEGGQAVPWTKPEAIELHQHLSAETLSTVYQSGFRAAFVDGHVEVIDRTTSEDDLCRLIVRLK